MTTSPYAPIQRLPASAFTLRQDRKFWGSFDEEEDLRRRVQMGLMTQAQADEHYTFEDIGEVNRNAFAQLGLGQFNSKREYVKQNPDGSITVALQQPGEHKNNLVEVQYRADPNTGEWVMQGNPHEYKRESTTSSFLKGAAGIGAAVIGGGHLLSGLLGAGGAAAGSSAAASGGTAAGGASSGLGGIAQGATGIAQGGAASGVSAAGAGLGTAGATAGTAGAAGAAGAAGGTAGAATGGGSLLDTITSGASSMFGDFKPSDWINLGGLVAGIATRPKAPDTSGLNAAAESNAEIARGYLDLGNRQYADQKAIFDEFKPMLLQQIQQSIASQAKTDQRSDAQWADYENIWRPQEKRLSEMTLAMSDPARFRADADRAGSQAATEFDRARMESRRSLEMAGASPEKIAAMEAAGRLVEAKGVAGASDRAFRESETRAVSLLDNAARFGRNMPSTGLQTAALAGQQGAQAVGGINNLTAAAAQPAQAAFQGFQGAVGANNASANLFGQAASLQQQGQVNTNNAVLGTFAGLNRWFGSSEKTKKMGPTLADAGAKVAASPSKRWAYKPGEGDGNTKDRMGPTAESLAAAAPEVSDGKRVDAIAMLGLHHGAIGEHESRIARLEKALTLADAA